MTNENHANHMEQAFDALRNSSVPEGPPSDLVEQTFERLRSLDRAAGASVASSSRLGFQLTRSRVAITVATLIVTIVSWLGLMGLPGTLAFADVQQQIGKVQTARYIETRLVELPGDQLAELRELARNTDDFRPDVVLGNVYPPRIITIRGPHRQRTEILGAFGEIEWIQISDLQAGKWITLHPKQKKLVEITSQVTIQRDSGKTSEEPVKPVPDVDLIANIREIPADATTRLPERTIGGTTVVGFFSRKTMPAGDGTATWERTYWVDPATKLPVRVEISHYSTDPRIARSDWVLSGFVFDEDVPESEFSMELPVGYTREATKIHGIK